MDNGKTPVPFIGNWSLYLLSEESDSNLRSLAARHVSSVLVSTAHPYFHWISGAKVQCHSAAFLRNKKKLQKMIIFR